MRQDYTDVTILLDRSGSMESIKDDMVGGFNSFINEQKKNNNSKCLISLYQFDNHYNTVYEGVNVSEAPNLILEPRGSTALLDAIQRTINATGNRLRNMTEYDRPSKVLFMIITDGLENASVEATRDIVKNMINHQREKYSWEFIFIGAGIDAVTTAKSYGIQIGKALNAIDNSYGVKNLWASSAKHVTRYRDMSQEQYRESVTSDTCFTDDDIQLQNEAKIQ